MHGHRRTPITESKVHSWKEVVLGPPQKSDRATNGLVEEGIDGGIDAVLKSEPEFGPSYEPCVARCVRAGLTFRISKTAVGGEGLKRGQTAVPHSPLKLATSTAPVRREKRRSNT